MRDSAVPKAPNSSLVTTHSEEFICSDSQRDSHPANRRWSSEARQDYSAPSNEPLTSDTPIVATGCTCDVAAKHEPTCRYSNAQINARLIAPPLPTRAEIQRATQSDAIPPSALRNAVQTELVLRMWAGKRHPSHYLLVSSAIAEHGFRRVVTALKRYKRLPVRTHRLASGLRLITRLTTRSSWYKLRARFR